jgi:type II secretory pathway pseudopilin PulG
MLELLIVVGILALLATFTVPTYQLLISQAQLNAATNQVADILRLQEQKTVTEQQVYGVTFTTGSTTVPEFLCQNVGCTSKLTTNYTLPANVRIDLVNFSSSTDIRFTTSGAPSVSGDLTLKDTQRGKSRRIYLKPSGAIEYTSPEF